MRFALQEALQAEEPERVVDAVKAVKVEEARAEVQEAKLINDLRSGARGNDARQRLLDLEARRAIKGLPHQLTHV